MTRMLPLAKNLEEIKQHMVGLQAGTFKIFADTDQFPELSEATRMLLKDVGLFHAPGDYPYLHINNELVRLNDSLICIGKNRVDNPVCIDPSDDEKVILYRSGESKVVINTSIRRFLETQYIFYYYYSEIEFKELLGAYREDENRLKYTQILKDMLLRVEPELMQFNFWSEHILDMETGIL
jgi:hypothetical protein